MENLKPIGELLSIVNLALLALALFALWLLSYFSSFVLGRLAHRSPDRRLKYLRMQPVARILIWSAGFYLIVVGALGPSSNIVIALSASLGIAIGLASEDLLKNVIGGLIIIFENPFQVGDKIRVGDFWGEVSSIGLWSTKLVTNDDSLVTVPNLQVINDSVANGNAGSLDFEVLAQITLPASVDAGLARRIGWEAAVSSPYVYLNKPIVVNLSDEMREKFLTVIKIKAFVLDVRLEPTLRSDVTMRAKLAMMKHGLYPAEVTMGVDPEEVKDILLER